MRDAVLCAFGVRAWVAFRDVATFEAWEADGPAVGRCPADVDARPHLSGQVGQLGCRHLSSSCVPDHCAPGSLPRGTVGLRDHAHASAGSSAPPWWPGRSGACIAELSTRPVIARIYAEFPHLSAPEGHGMSLRTKTLLPVPARDAVDRQSCVGGLAGLFDEPIEQIGAAILISLVLQRRVRRGPQDRGDRGRLATRRRPDRGVERISTGDLGSRVPITSADELAVLGRAVNEMSERLAAHDAEMRASRARIVAASDEARRNVERDLHDGAQQYLVLLELKLGHAHEGGRRRRPEASGAGWRRSVRTLAGRWRS